MCSYLLNAMGIFYVDTTLWNISGISLEERLSMSACRSRYFSLINIYKPQIKKFIEKLFSKGYIIMRMYCRWMYSVLCYPASASFRQFAALFCCSFLLSGRGDCGSVLCPSGFSWWIPTLRSQLVLM